MIRAKSLSSDGIGRKTRNMAQRRRFSGMLAFAAAMLAASAAAQVPASRVPSDWRASQWVVIAAKPALPQGTADLGAAPAGARVERVLLLLQPSAAQQK